LSSVLSFLRRDDADERDEQEDGHAAVCVRDLSPV